MKETKKRFQENYINLLLIVAVYVLSNLLLPSSSITIFWETISTIHQNLTFKDYESQLIPIFYENIPHILWTIEHTYQIHKTPMSLDHHTIPAKQTIITIYIPTHQKNNHSIQIDQIYNHNHFKNFLNQNQINKTNIKNLCTNTTVQVKHVITINMQSKFISCHPSTPVKIK